MIKYPIFFVVLFVIPYCFASYRTFLPAKVGCVFHTSKQQGTAGKYRELEGKDNISYRLSFSHYSLISSFTVYPI